ncbi:MAG TPA: hypothetical protein VK348_08800 [Planctomycetota bacterium]|nr:hypothetical protein [Planctomycetota bacterium]
MRLLHRLFDVQRATAAERRATAWTAAMFACAMASTFVLRPLRDQFGVDQGPRQMPHLYTITLAVTLVFTPLFWWLIRRRSSRQFVPLALQAFAASMVLWFFGLGAIGDFDWKAPGHRWIGEAFWGFFSAFNVAVPTLVWIHIVEYFRREQGLRLFGLVSVGGTLGAVIGPQLARWLTQGLSLRPAYAAIGSLLLLQATWYCHRRSQRACAAALPGAGIGDQIAPGSALAGLRLLARSPRLLGIAGYMVLLAMVATAFAVAKTQLVGEQVAGARDQLLWFADVETWTQTLTLALQLFTTSRLLRRLPQWLFLCLLPLLGTLGLGALWVWPTALAIGIIEVLRRGGQFALEKPARELLYTPLDLATKHKVKFLLDTVAFRFGDLLGAHYQVTLREYALSSGTVALATVALAIVWAVLGVTLGRRPERAQPAPIA